MGYGMDEEDMGEDIANKDLQLEAMSQDIKELIQANKSYKKKIANQIGEISNLNKKILQLKSNLKYVQNCYTWRIFSKDASPNSNEVVIYVYPISDTIHKELQCGIGVCRSKDLKHVICNKCLDPKDVCWMRISFISTDTTVCAND